MRGGLFAIVAATLAGWLLHAAGPGVAPVSAPAPPPPSPLARAPFGPQDAVPLALADAKRLTAASGATPAQDLQGYRYFYFSSDAAVLAERKAAFQLHLNFLSKYAEVVKLELVHPRLCRVDLDMLGWPRGVLEAAQHTDVFCHKRERLAKATRFRLFWPGGPDTRAKGVDRDKAFKKAVFEQDSPAGSLAPLAGGWLPARDWLELQTLLFTQVPVLNAEWFLAQSSRQVSLRNKDDEGLGYYDFLGLKNREAFFQLVVFDKAGAERLGKQVRAAQELSGVSPTPRQMAREQSQAGPLWVALDTDLAQGEGVAIRQLKEGTFKHQIEEWYGVLANGLPVTFLANAEGVRQNNAPSDKAGFKDDSPLNESRDGRIHVHLACLRCHAGQVLKGIDDWVRKTYHGPTSLGDPDKREALKLRRQYFSDISKALKTDRERYQEAFREATTTPDFPQGLPAQRACEVYARAYHAYADDPVTLAVAARELGVSEAAFEAQLKRIAEEVKLLDARLAPLVRLVGQKEPLPVSRLTWEDAYELAQEIRLGLVPQLRKP